MSARTLVGLVPIVFAMQPLALAQFGGSGGSAPAPNFVPLDPNEYMHYSGATPANFKRTVIGRLTNDEQLDTVTLAGNTPVMLENVAIYGHQVTLPMTGDDVEVVPMAVSSTIDGLAVCTSIGVEVWGHDLAAAAPYFSKMYTLGGIWAGATAVRCRADVGGGTWFAGIRAGGQNVGVRAPSGAETSLALTSQVKEIQWCNWDLTTTEPELAVLQSDRVTVYAPSAGFALKFQWSLGSSHGMTVAAAGTDPTDRDVVAVLHTIAGVKQLLYVHSLSGSAVAIDLPTTMNYKAITSGDATGDGRTDLFVQVGRWYAPLYFEHTASASLPYIPPGDGVAPPTTTDWGTLNIDDDPILLAAIANNAVAAPCVADMNLDGRADIVIAMNQSTGTLNQAPMFYLLQSSLSPTQGTYYVNSGPLHYILQSFVSEEDGSNNRTMIVRFLTGGNEPPPGNALEVSIWRQSALGTTINTPPVQRKVHVYDSTTMMPSPIFSSGLVCQFNEPELCGEGAPVYWAMILPVTLDEVTTNPDVEVTYAMRHQPKFAAMVSTCPDYASLYPLADKTHSLLQLDPPSGSNLTVAGTCAQVSDDQCPPAPDRTTPAPAFVGRRRAPNFGPSAQLNSTGQPHFTGPQGSTIAY